MIRQKVQKTSLSIKITTIVYLLFTAGMIAASAYKSHLFVPGIILGVIFVFCYFWSPVEYEITGKKLHVKFHLGSKEFGPVVKLSLVEKKMPFTLRLWGNGGLFAGTGIFWNKLHGVFRIYITSTKFADWVLVETESGRVLISPENSGKFIESAESRNI